MPDTSLDAAPAIDHYRQVVQVPTVSRLRDEGVDWSAFVRIRGLLEELYPAVFSKLELAVLREHALLFRWAGRSATAPVVLMAHLDVVGADPEAWTNPPFSGEIVDVDGEPTIFGRGCIDDKASLVGILEAVEHHLDAGFEPANDIWLAFTHNEEVLGDGTPTIVAHLDSLGIRPAMVLDEGGIVGEHIFGPVSREVVYVGVSEKGTSTLRLHATAPGGHASVPPVETCTVRLVRALARIADAPPKPILSSATRAMIAAVGPHADGAFKRAAELLNTDDAAAITEFSAISRDAWAMVHSAPVITMLTAGHSSNAIPERASATVNIRVSPGHPVAGLIEWVTALVDDPGIEVEVVEARDASPVSPATGPAWERLAKHVRAVYGDVLVVPYVNNGGTDSRNYTGISDFVYRFNPVDMTLAERGTLHAVDERLRIASFVEALQFYRGLVADL